MPERCWCGAQRTAAIAQGNYTTPRGSPGRFSIVVCRVCDTARTLPRPVAVDYGGSDMAGNDRVAELELWRAFARESLAIVKRYRACGRVLDVGSNIGVLVDEANRCGYAAAGIDPDRSAVAFGREKFGVDLTVGTIDTAKLSAYDVIMLEQTLEHVPDPLEFIAGIKQRMRRDSILVISVPNYRGLFPVLTGASWYGYWPWEHIWHFSPVALARVAARTGFPCPAMHWRRLYHEGGWQSRRRLKETLIDAVSSLPGLGDKLYCVLRNAE